MAFPSPELLESLSVPRDDCLGFDDNERVGPFGPTLLERDPKGPIGVVELGTFDRTFEHGELLTQSQVFESELMFVFQQGFAGAKKRFQ